MLLPTRTRKPWLRSKLSMSAPPVCTLKAWKSSAMPSNAVLLGTASAMLARPEPLLTAMIGLLIVDRLDEYSVQPADSWCVPVLKLSRKPTGTPAGLPLQARLKLALPIIARAGEPAPYSDGTVALPQPAPSFWL